VKSDRSRRALRFLLVTALAVPVLASASLASAAPSAADMETARTLFVEGKALRDKHDLPGALDRFRAAHALGRTPITAVELGRTLVLMGRLTEAREVLLEVSHIAPEPNESPARVTARKDAADLVEAIRTRIPSLVLSFPDLPPGAATPHVEIDGAAVPGAAIALPRKVDPGTHTAVATLDSGARRTVTVTAKEGETVPVAFVFGADATPVAAPVAPLTATATAAPAHASHSGVPALTWVGLAVAGAGVVAGSITGALTLSDASTIKSDCGSHPSTCGDSKLGTAKTLSTVSDVSFAVAGAGAVLAAVTFFTRDRSPPPSAAAARSLGPHVEPWLGLGAAGVRGAF
jgi:hypothetical protein